MMADDSELSPAKQAGVRALAEVMGSLEKGKCFKLEAGAGAGKTYSLIKALEFLIEREGKRMPRYNQRIACITFTNVAKDQIASGIDKNPLIHCDTIHGFCWSIISGFQSQLRKILGDLHPWNNDLWKERLEEAGGIATRKVGYELGHRRITDGEVFLHHDDILPLTIKLLDFEKFRNILSNRYPVILIDEYQDTDKDWIEAIKLHYLGKDNSPLFGFFGDHWQKIYGNGCGEIIHPFVNEIGKEANFRSVSAIVDCLNRMRPELPQFVENPDKPGEVHIFHTNNWVGQRQTGAHTKGDLPDDDATKALSIARQRLTDVGWDFGPDKTKILMLTHRALGKQQGYSSLPTVFRYNDSFTKKEQPHIEFFVDHLEPACQAFINKKYGEMFAALGGNKQKVSEFSDKERWAESFQELLNLRESGTVANIIAHLRKSKRPQLPDSVGRLEQKLENFDPSDDEEMPRSLDELQKLHAVQYKEIIALTDYLQGHSPFETKHGVKGAQFENVLVVLGRGWNQYNFSEMLEMAGQGKIAENRKKKFERNRNLFYVSCSRPKKKLALLFTQELSCGAIQTVKEWFNEKNIIPIF
jgi:ATP-dependent DNA helicase UvrD/PcrA